MFSARFDHDTHLTPKDNTNNSIVYKSSLNTLENNKIVEEDTKECQISLIIKCYQKVICHISK